MAFSCTSTRCRRSFRGGDTLSNQLAQDIAAISAKLDRIIRILALNAIASEKSIKEKALALSSAGLSPSEIADLVGTTAHSVSQTLSAAKKSRKRPTKKRRGKI